MKIFPAILALFMLANPAWGQNLTGSEANTAFWAAWAFEYSPEGRPDYQKAAALYEQAAAAGSREALLALARLSAPHGPLWKDGVLWRDRLLAASRAGWPEAAYTLARALEAKEVDAPDLNPAEYYVQAAAAGHGPAARRLGEMCLAGNAALNIAKDDKQAAIWFTMAAENHEEAAALALGKMFFEKDRAAAARWLEGARLPEAAYLLGEIRLKEGRFVEAVNSFTVAADQGYASAHLSLGLLNLDNDFGRRPDEREALRRLKIAAQADLPEAAYQLAHMYIDGRATPKDSISGAFWLNRAADKGHSQAREEYEKLTYNFSVGQKKRLERMIEDGVTPTMQTAVE